MVKHFTDEEFIAAWNTDNSAKKISEKFNISERQIYKYRKRIEEKYKITLKSTTYNSRAMTIEFAHNNVRTNVEISDGCIIVASDCHYWPGIISTAHKALVSLTKSLKPNMVVINGDAFDGSSISRHDPIMWEQRPSVKQELDACKDRLWEVEKVCGNASLHWNWGNHDQRFNTRLSSQVGDGFKDIQGFDLKDHFPRWKFSMSMMVNESCMIKHRFNNGIHAIYNNVLRSGTSMVTGHLHSLKVTPYSDYNGTRYGVDTGCLADPHGSQFGYAEDNPKNHRSGFAVLTYYNGKLMPPELCEVIDEDEGLVHFRGKLFSV